MDYELDMLKDRVTHMVGNGDISLLFNEIKKDIAFQILRTPLEDKVTREMLYMQSQGCTLLEQKFQEYLNDVNRKKESE
ncbi:MAG: hypothetical protein ACRDCA_00270 [Serratia sp. (in: enterobacteria)]|uniref:hypothetical protein n=1 Tax=Serratia sp. (in: enterobacteria) TaxID=616 RepID=UPI003F3AF3DE